MKRYTYQSIFLLQLPVQQQIILSMPTLFILILTLLLSIILKATPEGDKVGVILVYDSKQTSDSLHKYIVELNTNECQIITQINIIVEYSQIKVVQELLSSISQDSSQKTIMNVIRQEQKKPLYKFRPIKGTTSDYYFVGNLNGKQTCKTIDNYLFFAKKYAISGIIPLIGQDQHTSAMKVDLKAKESQTFVYHKYANSKYFQMVQNIRFISRHIMQVSTTKIREVELMSKDLLPHCQQIFLNFIIVHFYPEFKNKIFRFGNNLKTQFDKIQSEEKNKCMNKYIDILGYVPVYYQKRGPQPSLWKNPNEKKIVDLKRSMLERQIAKEMDQTAHDRRLFSASIAKESLPEQHTFKINTQLMISILSTLVILLTIILITLLLLINNLKNDSKAKKTIIQSSLK